MSDIRRSGGVTAAAVIGLIGSLGAAGIAVMMALAAVAVNSPAAREQLERQPTPSPVSPMAIMLVMSAMAFGCAAWGTASAVGVLRLKNWGRLYRRQHCVHRRAGRGTRERSRSLLPRLRGGSRTAIRLAIPRQATVGDYRKLKVGNTSISGIALH
jgi:hypothetical protein